MKGPGIVVSLMVVVVCLATLVSPALAQEPQGITGTEALAGVRIDLSAPAGRLKVGDRITIHGTVSGLFAATAVAGGRGSAALAGSLGDFSWRAGVIDPGGNIVESAGTKHVAAALALAAAGQIGVDPPNIPMSTDWTGDPSITADAVTFELAAAIAKEGGAAAAAAEAQAFPRLGLVGAETAVVGGGVQHFSFDFIAGNAGQWKVCTTARSLALALSVFIAEDSISPNLSIALARLSSILMLWVNGHAEWKPVAEHAVFTNLPGDARWGDLRRLEMDGTWVYVPPLKPADSLPDPVHADLMIHGSLPCTYALRICDISGACRPTRYLTVHWTGSDGVQTFDYPGLPTSSPVTAQPVF